MSKQYLTLHTLQLPNKSDVFSIAVTPTSILTASGGTAIHVHNTTDRTFDLQQEIKQAHPLGCHHISSSADGQAVVSVGFGGEVKIWRSQGSVPGTEGGPVGGSGAGEWIQSGKIEQSKKKDAGEIWAIAVSSDARTLATTSHDGRVGLWDLSNAEEGKDVEKVLEFETKGSFGMAVALSPDMTHLASAHQAGSLHLFSLTSQPPRLLHSLQGLLKPIRTIAFSPLGTLLAAAGDSSIIALYDTKSGEQVKLLTGHGGSWITGLDWSSTGEWLVSCSVDGKVRVWSVETGVCVAVVAFGGEEGGAAWSVKFLPKSRANVTGGGEVFAVAGKGGVVSFFREASGG